MYTSKLPFIFEPESVQDQQLRKNLEHTTFYQKLQLQPRLKLVLEQEWVHADYFGGEGVQ